MTGAAQGPLSLPAGRPGPVERFGLALFGVFVFLLAFDVSEPSPYDFLAPPTMLLWLAIGLRVPRDALFFVGLLLVYWLGLALALVPYLDQSVSLLWVVTSAYLIVTAVFFVMFFSEDSERRAEVALKALMCGCLVAAAAGIAGYFDILGSGESLAKWGRATGPFKDSNVFGSFLVFGILYLVRRLVTGEARPVLSLIALPVILAGVFLSFSRGSWISTVLSVGILLSMIFTTSDSGPVRRRIALFSFILLIVGGLSILGLLSLEEVRAMFENRAQVQDYDMGETGRFGNQIRSIPMLLERPLGFGALRFRAIFGLEPHNSYLGAFANGGWISGLAFIGLMVTTALVGLRLCLRPSPYRRMAQTIWPMQLTFLLQSIQIDIDHWRHAFLVWGMIWGLEVARRRWQAAQSRAPRWTEATGFAVPAGAG